MNSYIHVLPAKHGDAIIIHCVKGDNKGIIIVDGGPCTNPRLNPFISEVEKIEQIDLMVLTHHDSDHITGLLHYFKCHSNDDNVRVKEIWANCARHIDFVTDNELSSKQAGKLADYLDFLLSNGKIAWRSDINNELRKIELPYASLEIIGPSLKTYEFFMKTYEEKIKHEVISLLSSSTNSDIDIPCTELAKREKLCPNPHNYDNLTNMASISFILRCDGLSVLMLGDSYPQELVECLLNRGYSKENKLVVDYVKISHHGSQHNTNNDLLDLIECNNFIISTNGGLGQSRHPQRETIANILCHPERNYTKSINFFFNYSLNQIQRYGNKLFNDQLDNDLNYNIYEPTSTDSIITHN